MDIERVVVRLMADATEFMGVFDAVEARLFAFGSATIAHAVAEIARLGAQFEMAGVQFEVFLGSLEKGKKMLKEIQDLALRSPGTTMGLVQNARTMLGSGVPEGSILPALENLTNISAGDETRMKRLALAYSQVVAAGRFMGGELRQFTEAGVGIEDFAKGAGKSSREFLINMRSGRATVNDMIEGINKINQPGGRMAGMSERTLQTVSGQWTQLVESAQKVGATIGVKFFEKFNIAERIGEASDALLNMQKYVDPLLDWADRFATGLSPALDALQAMEDVFSKMLGSIGVPSAESVGAAMAEGITQLVVAIAKFADTIELIILQLKPFTKEGGGSINPETGEDTRNWISMFDDWLKKGSTEAKADYEATGEGHAIYRAINWFDRNTGGNPFKNTDEWLGPADRARLGMPEKMSDAERAIEEVNARRQGRPEEIRSRAAQFENDRLLGRAVREIKRADKTMPGAMGLMFGGLLGDTLGLRAPGPGMPVIPKEAGISGDAIKLATGIQKRFHEGFTPFQKFNKMLGDTAEAMAGPDPDQLARLQRMREQAVKEGAEGDVNRADKAISKLLPSLNLEQGKAAIFQWYQDLKKTTGQKDQPLAQTFMKDSVEAQDVINRSMIEQLSVEQEVLKTLIEAKEIERQQKDYMERVAIAVEALKKGGAMEEGGDL